MDENSPRGAPPAAVMSSAIPAKWSSRCRLGPAAEMGGHAEDSRLCAGKQQLTSSHARAYVRAVRSQCRGHRVKRPADCHAAEVNTVAARRTLRPTARPPISSHPQHRASRFRGCLALQPNHVAAVRGGERRRGSRRVNIGYFGQYRASLGAHDAVVVPLPAMIAAARRTMHRAARAQIGSPSRHRGKNTRPVWRRESPNPR